MLLLGSRPIFINICCTDGDKLAAGLELVALGDLLCFALLVGAGCASGSVAPSSMISVSSSPSIAPVSYSDSTLFFLRFRLLLLTPSSTTTTRIHNKSLFGNEMLLSCTRLTNFCVKRPLNWNIRSIAKYPPQSDSPSNPSAALFSCSVRENLGVSDPESGDTASLRTFGLLACSLLRGRPLGLFPSKN